MKVAAPAGAVSISDVISGKKEQHIRGFLAFLLVGTQFLLIDVFTRLVIAPLGRVQRWREPVFRWWMRFGRKAFLLIMRVVGGAHIDV
jgi:hypothetical protein